MALYSAWRLLREQHVLSVLLPGLCFTCSTNDILNPPHDRETPPRHGVTDAVYGLLWVLRSPLRVGRSAIYVWFQRAVLFCERKRLGMKGWAKAHVDAGSLVSGVTLSIKVFFVIYRKTRLSQNNRMAVSLSLSRRRWRPHSESRRFYRLVCTGLFIPSFILEAGGGQLICLG